MKHIFYILFVFIARLLFAQNSVLSTGEWVKVSVEEEGIYKLNSQFFSENFSIDPSEIDPKNIRVFGGPSGMLPQKNSAERAIDLVEIPIEVFDNEDGKLDNNEFIIFYGQDPYSKTLQKNGLWSVIPNYYDDKSYYFITISNEPGKRITQNSEFSNDQSVITVSDELIFIDENQINRISTGRNWYSFFSQDRKEYNLELDGLLDSVFVHSFVNGQSEVDSYMKISFNNEFADTINFNRVRQGTYDIKGRDENKVSALKSNSESLKILYEHTSDNNAEILTGHMDRLVLSYRRKLEYEGTPLFFQRGISLNVEFNRYQITLNSSADRIWDISDFSNVEKVSFQSSGNSAFFNDQTDSQIKRYAIFNSANLPEPSFEEIVVNQNIRNLNPKDGVIVTHPDFLNQANKLADFHRSHDNLDVAVVTTEQIYNEFSYGRVDVTAIRDLIRNYYEKSSEFRYALLIGDGSFDYMGYLQVRGTNLVPTYQSRNSMDPVLSYASDDYFGFMEPEEGEWEESFSGDHTLEVGIGRLPVNNQEDAQIIVDKIIEYATNPKVFGDWKNQVSYVADDEDGNLHVEDAEELSRFFVDNQPQLSLTKLYLDIFEQEIESNIESSPQFEQQLIQTFSEGTFLMNFIGHGNETQWMREKVFDNSMIEELNNEHRLPVIVTATCEYGRFDDPVAFNGKSGAENLLFKEKGGAIALLTTSRPVFASSNYIINAAFHVHFFELENGEFPRLGDVMRKTKNNSLRGERNRNFILLGDPMLKPAYPKNQISFTEINQKPFNQIDTLSALEKVMIKGEIQSLSGQLIEDFNGTATINIFDRQTEKKTRGKQNPEFVYTVQENRIFKGQATVSEGMFEIEFIVPKNISYVFENGKIEAYAVNDEETEDASGASRELLIGGTSKNAEDDRTPPTVQLFVNDSTRTTSTVGRNALLFANVFDESGINMTGLGLGQNIELTLSDGRSFILNDYYTANADTYQRGTIVFPIRDLTPGNYTAELKIFDTYNNSTVEAVNFIVSEKANVDLYSVINYPNPVQSGSTTFSFEHNRPGESLNLKIHIYDMNGKMIQIFETEAASNLNKVDGVEIDLAPFSIDPGIYFYRLSVESDLDNATGEYVGRLIYMN